MGKDESMRENLPHVYGEFRGPEADIKARLKKYIRYFTSCRRVLDIGCGRGEFLELLRENKISAMGVDSDENMVEICRGKALDVIHDDIFEFLKGRTEVYHGIFCSQVIEHMRSREAMDLLDLCHQALTPEGVLVLITLNPRNIRVVTNIFWLDLTHERLYPLRLLEQLVLERGFEIMELGDDLDTTMQGIIGRFLRKVDIHVTRGIFFSGVDIFVAARKGGNDPP